MKYNFTPEPTTIPVKEPATIPTTEPGTKPGTSPNPSRENDPWNVPAPSISPTPKA